MAATITATLVAGSIVLLAAPAHAGAGTFTQNDIEYAESGAGTATAIGYVGSGGSISIPATVEDASSVSYSVTAVGDGAFSGVGVSSLALPAGLITIGDNAFENNQPLATVEIPSSVTSIGAAAFTGTGLSSLTLHVGLITIGAAAFENNQNLAAVEIPSSVTTIGARAFGGTLVSSLILHDGLLTIGDAAFENASLLSLHVPASVSTIGADAFTGNAIATVTFDGAAPSIEGVRDVEGPLGAVAIVHYRSAFGFAAIGGNGYTAGTWLGYDTVIDPIVFFDTDGHGTIDPQLLTAEESPVEPTEPSQTGWIFEGWYDSNDFTDEFDFSVAPTDDVTAFAKWTAIDPLVSFNMGGHGSATAQQLTAGDAPAVPTAPVAAGFTFGGWYTDGDLTTLFDFTHVPLEDVTVYAKWTVVDPIVSFNTGGHGTVTAQQLTAGQAPVVPTAPVAGGWQFDGWFTSDALTTAFDFTSVPLDNVTVFAKWTAVAERLTLDLDVSVGDTLEGTPLTMSGTGLAPFSDYTVILRSTPVLLVGGKADASGSFNATAVFPAGLSAGQHTVTLSGTDVNGNPLTRVAYLTVLADGTVGYLSYVAAGPADSLATTGFDGAPIGFAALLLLLAGLAMVVGRRRSVS